MREAEKSERKKTENEKREPEKNGERDWKRVGTKVTGKVIDEAGKEEDVREKDWERVKYFFLEISRIPRNSGQEERIGAYLLKKAEAMNRPAKQDDAGNIWIGTFPGKKAEYLFQAHQDMVCVKEERSDHDFSRDPIEVTEEDGWLGAQGTTLGADNGIGMAYLLAILEEDTAGKVEGLFTVGEEIGMQGANRLEEDTFPIQAEKLLNLDTAWDQVMVEGSAMGVCGVYTLPVKWKASEPVHWYETRVEGLSGGHSGTEAYKKGANGIRLLAEFLEKIPGKWNLAFFEAEGCDNVISNNAKAVVGVPDAILFEIYFEMMRQRFRETHEKTDPNLSLKKREIKQPQKQLRAESKEAVIRLLNHVSCGVLKSADISEKISDKTPDDLRTLAEMPRAGEDNPKLVEKQEMPDNNNRQEKEEIQEVLQMCSVHISANPASVVTTADAVILRCHYRSVDETFFERKIWRREQALAEATGAILIPEQKAAGWQPETTTSLKQELTEAYLKARGKRPVFVSIPATLECGEIKRRLHIKEAVSVGPIMVDYHTPKERLQIESAAGLYQVLKEVLNLS